MRDPSARSAPRGRFLPSFLALIGFIALSVVHTWPLARNPAHLSRNDNADTLLNTWTIAWVAHELPRRPLHLFDANIFYPERLTLAYSESMIVQGVLAMPILAAGGSPVLAYNLVLMMGFALTGWAFCLLVRDWTGSWSAGYVSGSLAAFNAHTLVRLPHLQTLHVEFVALMLFALDRLFTRRRVSDAVWLGAGYALQGLTSMYLLVFSTWLAIFAVLGRAREWRPLGRSAALLSMAGAVGVLLLAPYLSAYDQVHRLTGFERTLDDARGYAASWTDFLTTGARVHFALWSRRYFEVSPSAAFPGVIASLLGGLAIADARRDARARMCLAAAAGCLAVLWLPSSSFYPFLHATIPLFRVVRVQAHLGQMVLLMVAVLAGFGTAALLRRVRRERNRVVAAVFLCVLVNAEALRAPIVYTPFTRLPSIYRALADQPGAVVVELPVYEPSAVFANAVYMLNSTLHWRPMLNGYSGFTPPSYRSTFDAVQTFPDEASLAALRARGVTHVVVHGEPFAAAFGADRLDAVGRASALQLLAGRGDICLYRLR